MAAMVASTPRGPGPTTNDWSDAGRRMPSWCSRWLPVVPLFSGEIGGPHQRPESAVRHTAVVSTASTPSAAPMPSAPATSAVPELTYVPRAPPIAGGVPPSLQPTDDPSGPSPAALRPAPLVPPLTRDAPPPKPPVSLAGKAAPWRKLVPQLLRQTYQHRATAGIAPVPKTLALVPIATVPAPVCTPSGVPVRDATAAALDERWANHWKAKKAKTVGPAPGTTAGPAIHTYSPCWPFAPSAHVALLVAPPAPAAPGAYCANPAAPTSTSTRVRIPSATGPGQQTMLTEVLDKMEAEAFEELLGYALTTAAPKVQG
jgi:hypothetical protein